MVYDYSLSPDPTKYFQIEYVAMHDPVPPEHASKNGVVARWRIVLPDDDLELHVEERKADWRVLLPNGMIKMCTSRANLSGVIEGIAIGRIITCRMSGSV